MTDAEMALFAIKQTLGLTRATESVHARHNLDGAYIDIERQWADADKVCLRTIDRVMTQIAAVEEILERFPIEEARGEDDARLSRADRET